MSPYILAIDTTREYGSIALGRGELIVEEVLIHAPDGTFLGTDNVMTLDLPGTPGARNEFFRVQTATPVFGQP